MQIKFRSVLVSLLVCAVLIFSSCGIQAGKQSTYEVDFKESKTVQVAYNHNVYNTVISYKNGCLVVEFSDTDDAFCGIVFTVGKDFCRTSFKGSEYELPQGKFTEKLFVNKLFSFISSADGVLITENYNEKTGCSYVTRSFNEHTFTFEVFENNGKFAYSLNIT